MKRKTPKRLVLNVLEAEHQEIKLAATMRNMTITMYVLQAVAWRLKNEKD